MTSIDLEDVLSHLVELEDGCSSNPRMKLYIQRLKLRISSVSPLVAIVSKCNIYHHPGSSIRWIRIELALRKIVRDFKSQTAITSSQLVVSTLQILKSLHKDLKKIIPFRSKGSISISSKSAEVVVSFIDTFLRNLQRMQLFDIPMTEGFVVLEGPLEFLRNFLWLIAIPLSDQENVRYIVNSAQNLVLNISYLLYTRFVRDDKLDDWLVNNMKEVSNFLMTELRDIYHESWGSSLSNGNPTMDERVLGFVDYLICKLKNLSNNNSPRSMIDVKDQTKILIGQLSFLRCSLMDLLLQLRSQAPIKEMGSLVVSVQALIIETGFFIYFDLDGEEDEGMANYLRFGIHNLLKASDNLKQQASDVFNNYLSVSWQSKWLLPSCNKLEFVNFFTKKLEGLLHSKAGSINLLTHHIEALYEEMESLRKCLSKIENLGNPQVKSLLTRTKIAACQAEFVTYPFVTGKRSLWYHKLGLFVVTRDIKIMQKEVKAILEMTCDDGVHSIGEAWNINKPVSCQNEMQNKIEEAPSKLVGLKDAEAEIIELLTGGSKQLQIISIVGMPGIGKTTLANSVYMHPSINLQFDVRAWCYVSQDYEKETLLFEIFGQIVGKTNQLHKTSQEDFVHKLYKNLKRRKFLIVIDDVWDIEVWNDLKETFPDDKSGSRILFTTRHHAVASKANSFPYVLRLLSNEESCQLLWMNLFDGENCPPELSVISNYIARYCKGLPLAVVLIAGILKRTERRRDNWEQVARNFFNSQGTQKKYLGQLEISNVFELSYKHLPDCLKKCFLFLGSFPEDTTILVSKLIQLWISEGLVQEPNQGQQSLEQEAENYLNDLIDRNLVMIARRSSKGGVKACRVHDVLRAFCAAKQEEDGLVMQEDKFGEIPIPCGDLEMPNYYNSHRVIISKNGERLCFPLLSGDTPLRVREKLLSERVVFRDRLSKGRAAFTDGGAFGIRNRPRRLDYGSLLRFKLLRVLDLGNVRVERSADTSDLVKISELVHLRYLSIRVRSNIIPSEISKLRNLEYFLLCGAIGEVILPEAFWNLLSLRHVLTDHSFFSFQYYSQEFFDYFSEVNNLKSISSLSLLNASNFEKFLRRLPNIKKLGCKFPISWDNSTGCYLFPVLDFLTELESLKVFFPGDKAPYPCKFSFPPNLKKLTMSNFHLPWDKISIIGQLPNLEVLKLLNKAFEGQQWDTKEGEFQKLKFLKLDTLDIELWKASSEHFPCLEQLVVLNCQKLEEIPSSFGEILTLQLIEMKWCSSSATDSVRQILKDQRDFSNNQLNVIIVGP